MSSLTQPATKGEHGLRSLVIERARLWDALAAQLAIEKHPHAAAFARCASELRQIASLP